MNAETIIEVIKTLIGEVYASGYQGLDEKRLKNLRVMERVANYLLLHIINASKTKDRAEWSMQEIGEEAYSYLISTKEWLEEKTKTEMTWKKQFIYLVRSIGYITYGKERWFLQGNGLFYDQKDGKEINIDDLRKRISEEVKWLEDN